MLESCLQRLFGVIIHVEFTFPQNGGGTVCNLRFTVPTTCSRPSTKMSAFSFLFFTVPTTF